MNALRRMWNVLRRRFSALRYRDRITLVICTFALLPFFIVSSLIISRQWQDKVNGVLDDAREKLMLNVSAINGKLLSRMKKLDFIGTNTTILAYLDNGDYSNLLNNMDLYDEISRMVAALEIDLGAPNQETFRIYPLDNRVNNGACIQKLERLQAQLQSNDAQFYDRLLRLDWDGYLWYFERSSSGAIERTYCFRQMKLLGKPLALARFSMGTRAILDEFSGAYPEGTILVYRPDPNGAEVLIKGEPSGARSGTVTDLEAFQTAGYYPVGVNLSYSGGWVAAYVPRTYVASSLQGYLWTTVLEFALILALLLVTIDIASRLLTRRLSKLIDSVTSDAGVPLEAPSAGTLANDDIGRMERKFYDMVERMQNFYQKSLQDENEKKALELELLQSRINPHFLYNTLSTLRWNSNNPRMSEIIDTMVSYYRLALGRGNSVVTLGQEVKMAEEYLKIQKYTYESDFTYSIDLEEGIADWPIVKNLLQPIVENAVLHGVLAMKSGGHVNLSGYLEGDCVLLSVVDNGLGMDAETVRRLLEGEAVGRTGGYGVRNVQKRMTLFYGPGSSLAVRSAPGEGTAVEIRLPHSHLAI